MVVIYALEKYILGIEVEITNVLMSFLYGGDIVDNGWFIMVIILLYELFYLSALYAPERVCSATLFFTITYMIVACASGMNPWWFITCLAFPMGLFLGRYKNIIDGKFEKNYYRTTFALVAIFILTLYIGYSLNTKGSLLYNIVDHKYFANLFLTPMHNIFFICAIVSTMMKISLEIKVFKWLSALYFEIYVLQGMVFNMQRNPLWNLDSDYLFFLNSLVFTIIFAMCVHPVFTFIMNSIKKSSN